MPQVEEAGMIAEKQPNIGACATCATTMPMVMPMRGLPRGRSPMLLAA
jgi:hypothetical protein